MKHVACRAGSGRDGLNLIGGWDVRLGRHLTPFVVSEFADPSQLSQPDLLEVVATNSGGYFKGGGVRSGRLGRIAIHRRQVARPNLCPNLVPSQRRASGRAVCGGAA